MNDIFEPSEYFYRRPIDAAYMRERHDIIIVDREGKRLSAVDIVSDSMLCEAETKDEFYYVAVQSWSKFQPAIEDAVHVHGRGVDDEHYDQIYYIDRDTDIPDQFEKIVLREDIPFIMPEKL